MPADAGSQLQEQLLDLVAHRLRRGVPGGGDALDGGPLGDLAQQALLDRGQLVGRHGVHQGVDDVGVERRATGGHRSMASTS